MMILLRIVLVLGLAYLIWKAWRMLRPPEPGQADEAFERMVQCKTCSVHIPRSEAHRQDDDYYCHKHKPDGD